MARDSVIHVTPENPWCMMQKVFEGLVPSVQSEKQRQVMGGARVFSPVIIK